MEKPLYLYKVTPIMPVYHSDYFVVASGMDKAADAVAAAENADGADCLGIRSVELVGPANGGQALFVVAED